MNKPVTSADLVTPKVTTGPLPASRKVYVAPDAAPSLRVRAVASSASSWVDRPSVRPARRMAAISAWLESS